MNLALWIIAGLLAAGFVESGVGSSSVPREKLARAPGSGWITDFSAGSIKAIGAAETLGRFGLILPAVLNIAPVLVRWPPGTGGTMIGAFVTHVRRHELKISIAPLFPFALAVSWRGAASAPSCSGELV